MKERNERWYAVGVWQVSKEPSPKTYYEREKDSFSSEAKKGKWAHAFFLQNENWTLASLNFTCPFASFH